MNLHYLEYFIVLEETGNMTRAAEKLYVSQSNLSQFLAHEEKKVGQKLFLRVNGKYVPTEAGRVYIDYAKQALELNRQFRERLFALSSLNTIRIGYTSSTASKMLNGVLPAFQKHYPGIQMNSLDISNLDTAIYFLTSGKLDLAFVTTWSKELYSGPTQLLAREELFLGVPASHPACQDFTDTPFPRLTAHRILQFFGESPFILPYEGSCIRHLVDDFFASAGCACNAALHASSVFTIVDMISCGLGIGFIPTNCVTPRNPSIKYFALTPKIYRLHAVYKKPDESSGLIDDLIKFAIHYYKNTFSLKVPEGSA